MSKENEKEKELEDQVRVCALAKNIELLLVFCSQLIPDIDLIERAMIGAERKQNDALSAAPLLEAAGMNYETVHLEWEIRRKRAQAIFNLVSVIKETENDRVDHMEKQKNMEQASQFIKKAFGL